MGLVLKMFNNTKKISPQFVVMLVYCTQFLEGSFCTHQLDYNHFFMSCLLWCVVAEINTVCLSEIHS